MLDVSSNTYKQNGLSTNYNSYYDYGTNSAPGSNYADYYTDFTPTRTGSRDRGVSDRYNYRYHNKPSMQQYVKVSLSCFRLSSRPLPLKTR